jgi:hypothetical protein
LTWAHYRVLSRIADKSQRKAVEIEAAKNRWTSRQLEERVRPLRRGRGARSKIAVPASTAPPKPLVPRRGTIGIYRITAGRDDAPALDLGFTSYIDLTPEQAAGLAQGDLVRLDAKGKIQRAEDARLSDLYTYPAEVLRVTAMPLSRFTSTWAVTS